MPVPPESISTATITIQAMPIDSRMPVTIVGSCGAEHVAEVGQPSELEHPGHVALVLRAPTPRRPRC